MTVKVEDTCEGSEADQGLGAGDQTDIDDISNNNSDLINSSQVNATSVSSSLDSVVQRLIHKSKMGRRKQNCPQRTGNLSEEGKQAINLLINYLNLRVKVEID